MPVDPKEVTNGYWYAKDRDGEEPYIIVEVFSNHLVYDNGMDDVVQYKKDYTFIAPVPAPSEVADISPDAAREEMVKLRQELNLPVHASVRDVMRAALALAKRTVEEYREKNP